jgi:DNA-binding transcriptional regulator YbjK
MKRKPNAEERRRDLCDAAIELLAEDGARGLTHLRVDRRAGVADGTTSFYFQTRSALLRGATDRKVQLDVADFMAAMNEAKAAHGDKAESSPASGRCPQLSQLAEQAMRTAVEPERSRARARFELLMVAAHDPELSAVFGSLMDQFVAISEEAVAQLRPVGRPADRELRHSGLTRIRPRTPAPRTRSNASAIRFSPSTGPITGAGSTVPLTNAAITSRNSSGV